MACVGALNESMQAGERRFPGSCCCGILAACVLIHIKQVVYEKSMLGLMDGQLCADALWNDCGAANQESIAARPVYCVPIAWR
jgi:hypothetical protein